MNNRCPRKLDARHASYAYDTSGTLFSMTRDGATYYYHTNARGDVVALSDDSGAVVNTYAYDPWGTLLAASETVSNPYRYASYRYDEATSLYYCWNRYYAPELARFLTRDIYPGDLENPVTMNPYLYCGGDPVNLVDPSGMFVFLGITITLVGCLQAIPAASIVVGGADAVIQGAAYIPVHHDFERNIACARSWREETVTTNPDAYQAATELEQTLRKEQLSAMGPVIGSAYNFLTGF